MKHGIFGRGAAGLSLVLAALVALLFGLGRAEGYTVLGYRWPGSHPRVPFYVSTSCDGHAPYNGPWADGIRAFINAAHVWNSQGDSNLVPGAS